MERETITITFQNFLVGTAVSGHFNSAIVFMVLRRYLSTHALFVTFLKSLSIKMKGMTERKARAPQTPILNKRRAKRRERNSLLRD